MAKLLHVNHVNQQNIAVKEKSLKYLTTKANEEKSVFFF